MQIASFVPATVKLRLLSSNCCTVGLMIYSFPIFPTTTPLTGPSKGISLIPKHKDAPNNAAITGELS